MLGQCHLQLDVQGAHKANLSRGICICACLTFSIDKVSLRMFLSPFNQYDILSICSLDGKTNVQPLTSVKRCDKSLC